ncbi:retrovirus-related pol polyprotein LINE-1 [Tanacetum coccineum]
MAVSDAARKPLPTINPSPNALTNLVALSKAWADAKIPTKPKAQRVAELPDLIFEALSSKDCAWYDVAVFLNFRVMYTGEMEVRVRFSGFSHDEDEWVNARSGVRERSIPLVASECHKVKVGDLVLCYRANEDHALYSDAHVVKIERQLHDDANCTCTFVVRFQYDNAEGRIEALGSDGNLRSCLSGQGGLGRYSESRSGRSGSRVKAFRRIRVGSWNVGSLTSKLLELVDALERHRVDIACFQETKWKGSSNKEVNGYKLWYSGSHTARNGVGVILRACLKDKVVHVNRCSDRIISLTLVIEGETVNVISAYAPQVGLSEEEKKAFWDSLDEVVRESPTDQRLILGGDLNGHIGATTEGYSGVHGGFGYGVRNEEGDLKACKDCKVFPGEACSSQHRLLAMDTLFKRVQCRRAGSGASRILWKNLNGDAAEAFRSRVSKGVGVAQAKEKAYEDLYKKLDSKEGANEIFRIAKARQRRRRDLGDICFIKDEGGRTVTDEEEIKQRWGEYFSSLFNTGEPEGHEGVVDQNTLPLIDCYYLEDYHTMKLWERVIERRLRRETSVSENQFGFMPGRSSIEAIHLIRSLMEKYKERQRDVHLAFIDLEKAYDSVPRNLIWKTLIDK